MKRNVVWLVIGFVGICTVGGIVLGVIIALEDDAPGAPIVVGGIAFFASSIAVLLWAIICKLLVDIGERLE